MKSVSEILEELHRSLKRLPEYVKAVLLFGSAARGEATERSDVDLLILHESAPLTDLVERRKLLYSIVAERVGYAFDAIMLVDMELKDIVFFLK